MKQILAKEFTGYGGLAVDETTKPTPRDGLALVRITAAGVTPLDHTILSGTYPRAKAPLVLGNEGAGVVEHAGGSDVPLGSRVVFTGGYGVAEDGAWREYALIRPEDLAILPDAIDDRVGASLPVAYLTAWITLEKAGFAPGKSVLAPAIGGSVGNATYQLARAMGATTFISTSGSKEKLARAAALGYDSVIDLASETMVDGVRRITGRKGVDIVIESLGGSFTGEGLSALAMGGTLVSLGYSAGRTTSVNVTDRIWKRSSMFGWALAAETAATRAAAWAQIFPLIENGAVKPLVERSYPLEQATEALRHLVEGRPFGKIVLETGS
jgi:NADPH:quinone reductase